MTCIERSLDQCKNQVLQTKCKTSYGDSIIHKSNMNILHQLQYERGATSLVLRCDFLLPAMCCIKVKPSHSCHCLARLSFLFNVRRFLESFNNDTIHGQLPRKKI